MDDEYAEDNEKIFQFREQQRKSAQKYEFNLEGVALDGHQAAVMKCKRSMPVMLIPAQPDHNDHGAVKLCSLDGRQLGLVPIGQSQLHQFNRPISFGRIIHLEPDVETHRKLYKATVQVQPEVEPFTAQAIPHGLFGEMLETVDNYYLDPAHDPPRAEGYPKEVECWHIGPSWQADEKKKVFYVEEFKMIPHALNDAQVDYMTSNGPAWDSMDIYCWMNGWSPDDAEDYFKYIQKVRKEREDQKWRFDSSCLERMGLERLDE